MQHLDEGTIHAWLDGALPAEEARQAEMHAAGCATCAEAVAEARGLIAASSVIISKLDGVLGAGDARVAGGPPAVHDIAAARASANSAQRPARRHWFAAPGLRAAAALLFLAGGVAVVQNVTGRDELARVVTDASPEAAGAREAEMPPPAPEVAMQDATAAGTAQAPAAPPPPTVGPAPVLPRPSQALGGMTPPRRDAPQGMVGDVSGTLRGEASGAARTEVSAAAAASVSTGGGVARAAVRVGSPTDGQRADPAPERDFSAAKSAAAAPPPASLAAPAAPLAQRDERRQAEENAVLEQRLVPQAAARARMATTGAAAVAVAADGAARCYALTLSPWSPSQATIPGAPATRIALSADTGTVGPSKGNRLVRPLPGAFQGSYDHAWYTEVSPSTLVLTWATGAEGIVMRLVRSGDVLTGTARTFGAPGSLERTSDVRGERVGCGEAR